MNDPSPPKNAGAVTDGATPGSSPGKELILAHSVPPRVLVVEDDPPIRDLLVYNLSREGFAVEATASGETALRLIRSHPPALVVLDLMLPGLDGWEVCRQIRRAAATRSVAVLIISARSSATDVARALNQGADAYLTKPFRLAELRMRARRLVEDSRGRSAGPGALTSSVTPLWGLQGAWSSIVREPAS